MRPIVLLGGARPADPDGPPGVLLAHTVIPNSFWRNPSFAYLGLEVFLPAPGAGSPLDWALARDLIQAALGCEGAPEGRGAQPPLGWP